MTNTWVIEAIANKVTGKLFVLVEDEGDGNVTVINPDGHVLHVAGRLFKDEVLSMTSAEAEGKLTPQQIKSLQKADEDSARKVDIDRRPEEPPTPTRTSTPRKSASKEILKNEAPRGHRVRAEWNSSRLTFFKHKIDPLRDREQFCVHVEGEGDVVLSKAEFQSEFNNVLMDPKYRSEGVFIYKEFPDFARRFVVKK